MDPHLIEFCLPSDKYVAFRSKQLNVLSLDDYSENRFAGGCRGRVKTRNQSRKGNQIQMDTSGPVNSQSSEPEGKNKLKNTGKTEEDAKT